MKILTCILMLILVTGNRASAQSGRYNSLADSLACYNMSYYAGYHGVRGHSASKDKGKFSFWHVEGGGYGQEYSVISGIWMLTGPLSKAGPQPFVGLTGGFEFNRLFFCLDGNYRFKNVHSLSLKYNDTLFSSQLKEGGYFGVDWRYKVRTLKRNELYLVGGFATDATGITLNTGRDIDFSSVNVNIGVGYKLLLSERARKVGGYWRNFLLVQAKYNYVNYHSNEGPGIPGNSFTLSFSLGSSYIWWLKGER